MNILFVLYGDFTTNSANVLALYAREFYKSGHTCAVAVPNNPDTVSQCSDIFFRPMLYNDVLGDIKSVFPDRQPADIIHAWTPRENIRHFITLYMAKCPTPLVVYLEDNESFISCKVLGVEKPEDIRYTDQDISARLSDSLSHPFRYSAFIGLADAVAVVQDKLKTEVPPWVCCETVMPAVDLDFFYPRPAQTQLRLRYGIAKNERVIVYTGGLNMFTRPGIESLCRSIGLLNQKGYPCRLVRTGPFTMDFLNQLPYQLSGFINDLGLVPRFELPDLLAMADVLVQPGKIDPFEDLRLPGKLPEFLAMGRPVVMPDANISNLFKDGEDAVLMYNGSAEEIAEKCIDLFSDPKRAEKIGQGGRRFAEKHFNAALQADRMMTVYQTARDNFDPAISTDIWHRENISAPITRLLARKLTLTADAKQLTIPAEYAKMLKEHARYVEFIQARVEGLEAETAVRDKRINDLNQSVAVRDKRINDFNQSVAVRDKRINDLNQSVAVRDATITEIVQSTSWRMSRPIRSAGHQIKTWRRIADRVKAAIRHRGGFFGTLKKTIQLYQQEGFAAIKRGVEIVTISCQTNPTAGSGKYDRNDYTEWICRYDTINDNTRVIMTSRMDKFLLKPLISVVMPVYNPKPEWLIEAIESVRRQIYPYWELCIADDASTNKNIREILNSYAGKDPRIKVVCRNKNGHISAASNSAVELASGEWIALLDHDDLLTEHALFWVTDTINQHPDICLMYSDEDKTDSLGNRFDPYFKCDWNVDLFYSHNMFSHLGVYRSDLVKGIGGFIEGMEGAQDYDLALRCMEKIKPHQIRHIPRVLYHWRMHSESTAASGDAKPYAMIAGERALNSHFKRQSIEARAECIGYGYRVRYELPGVLPLVSLIIPTKNGLRLLKQCVESIFEKTTYTDYELLIVDNGSDEPETISYLGSLESKPNVRILRNNRPFNYSALNNTAVKQAKGDILALLNNDIEIISPKWLTEMVSHAIRPGIGGVGAKLWYSDDTLQHAGVILGLGKHRVAGHPHYRTPKGQHGYFGRANLIQSFSAVTAACMVIRKSIYEEVGGLNEADLPVAYNDIDFCLRLREKGYRTIWTPYAEMYHHESAMRGADDTIENRDRFEAEVQFMKQQWGDALLNDPAYSPNLTLDHADFSLAWPPRIDQFSVNPIKRN